MKINSNPEVSNLTHSRTQQALQGLNTAKMQGRTDPEAGSVMAGGFALSIGDPLNEGGMLADPQGMDDFARKLQETDVQVKKDYMSVMSLSMSQEDYAEMVRTGRVPEDMDAADAVTILDHVKTAMIRGGADVAGYTDDVDMDVLAEITGSVSAAGQLVDSMHAQDLTVTEDNAHAITEAIRRASESLPLSDDAVSYMMSNGQAPTVDNIYNASHSGAASTGRSGFFNADGYMGRVAGEEDMDELMPQIEETIAHSGLEVNEETVNEGKWLISHGLPLTPETLLELDSLAELRDGMERKALTDAVAIAMSAGIPADKANLTYDESIYVQAENMAEEIKNMPDAAADLVASKGQILNLRSLRVASMQLQMSVTTVEVSVSAEIGTETDLSTDQLHARRVLEEARLSMSTQALRMLMRSNFHVDIAPMEQLVDALKSAEQALAGQLFPDADPEVSEAKASAYSEINGMLDDIFAAPASILGQYDARGTTFAFSVEVSYTLNEVHESGIVRRSEYLRAGDGYEALMTAPRADMGDSIQKAFQNVDDILKDLDLEVDELNRRAVRILGYNSLEITPERIGQVREADVMLRSVLNRLTPDRVMGMIRQDVNPLNMPIQELAEYLNDQDSEPERQAAGYARFLMQLERQNEITELERDSYVGIYRMISQLDRTDDAALGRLMAMGSEISFSTLLGAMRSSARSGMDYKVDDAFGGVESSIRGKAIDAQINAAFSFENMAESPAVSETVIENLLNSGSAVSLSNAEAMEAIRSRRGSWIRPIADGVASGRMAAGAGTGRTAAGAGAGSADAAGRQAALDRVDQVIREMTDRTSALDAYLDMLDGFESDLTEKMYGTTNLMDIRAIQSSMKQISIFKGFAGDETYDLPVEMDGELTSIRLTMRHDDGAGRVAITLATQSIGSVAAEFSFAGSASGYVACETLPALDRLADARDRFIEALGFEPTLVKTDRVDLARYTDRFDAPQKNQKDIKEDEEKTDINNMELYRVATEFIRILKTI